MTNNPGGVDLGSAYGSIRIDTSSIQQSVRQAQNAFSGALQSIGTMADELGQSFQSVGRSLSLITAPLTLLGATGVSVAASFEEVMTNIKAFGNVTQDELAQVSDFVLKMGADTVFTAKDAGNAMLDLLKSGLTMKEAMAALPSVLQLATVGNLGLAEAAGVASTAMAQFGMSAADAGKITDVLAQAANASRADVRDLGQALSNVGPIAKAYGLSLEDTAAILAVFANNGIMGAEAGTQLKSMLLNLSRPSDDVKSALQQLGVSLYDAQGNMRNFNDILKDLDRALDKLPVSQQNELMQKLAGSYGITGLNALRAAGGLDAMRKAMAAAPSATKITTDLSSILNRVIEALQGSLETLQTVALTPFIENGLKPAIQWLTKVINSVTDWAKVNPELTTAIVALLAAVTALGPVLFILGTGLSGVGTILGTMASAVAFLLSPIGLLVAAVGALGVAFATNFGGIRDAVLPILQRAAQLLGPLVKGFSAFFGELTKGKSLWDAAVSGIDAFVDALGNVQTTVNGLLSGLGVSNGSSFLDAIIGTGEGFAGAGPFEGIRASLMDALTGIRDLVEGVWTSTIKPILDGIGQGINDFIHAFDGADWSGVITLLQGIGLAIAGFVAAIVQGGLGVLEGLPTALRLLGEGLRAIVDALALAASGDVDGALSHLGDGLIKLGGAILTLPLSAAKSIADWLGGLFGIDIDAGLKAWEGVGESLRIIWDEVFKPGGHLEQASNQLAAWWTTFTGPSGPIATVWNAIVGPNGILHTAWNTIFGETGLLAVVVASFKVLWDSFFGTGGSLANGWAMLMLLLQQGFNGFRDAIMVAVNFIISGINGMSTALQGFLDKINSLIGGSNPLIKILADMMKLGNGGLSDEDKFAILNSISSIFTGKQDGGPVVAGQIYQVNENRRPGGPVELFKPSSNGSIIPIGQGGASPGTVDNSVSVTLDVGAVGRIVDQGDLDLLKDEVFNTVLNAVRQARQYAATGGA